MASTSKTHSKAVLIKVSRKAAAAAFSKQSAKCECACALQYQCYFCIELVLYYLVQQVIVIK